jgi:sec-independent protein translocase protein TatA
MHSMGIELFTPVHLLFLGILALLLFGPKRLPEIGRSLGNGIREFKGTVDGLGVTDAVHSANEVRSAVSPTNIARAAIPGIAEAQDTVRAVKGGESTAETPAATPAATPAEPPAADPA